MAGGRPSRTPAVDEAIELNIEAIAKIMDAQKLRDFLAKTNSECDEIRDRRYRDTMREIEIDRLNDAALDRLKELQQAGINNVCGANQTLEAGKKIINININMGMGDE